jgi:hypothetical protein
LIGIGQKIKQSIKVFLKTGTIPEAKLIESDAQFHAMNRFLKVWGTIRLPLVYIRSSKLMLTNMYEGVGQNLALEWWNSGYRTLDDVYENASLSPTIKLGIELFPEFEQRYKVEDNVCNARLY